MLNGIGEKLERKLWKSGILTWEDFIGSGDLDFISPSRKRLFDEELRTARKNLDDGNAAWFSEILSGSEHWRLFDAFKDGAVCLDIETSGYQPESGGYTTVVGLYDGSDFKCFIHGRDLTAERIQAELSRYKYLITFYGSVFDIPFLEKSLPGFGVRIPHFDLCFGTRKLGYKGGLKSLEREFGIQRDEDVVGMDGYAAVRLWERARRGSGEAMSLLLRYNREDTVNLMDMATTVYGNLRAMTGIEEYIQ
jgi:uncharacterized protein YprB with RNaseH-like and TPR domain